MDFYDSYTESEFETLGNSKRAREKKKRFRKAKKYLKKLFNRVIDTILYTTSQIALDYFARKFEKSFA